MASCGRMSIRVLHQTVCVVMGRALNCYTCFVERRLTIIQRGLQYNYEAQRKFVDVREKLTWFAAFENDGSSILRIEIPVEHVDIDAGLPRTECCSNEKGRCERSSGQTVGPLSQFLIRSSSKFVHADPMTH